MLHLRGRESPQSRLQWEVPAMRQNSSGALLVAHRRSLDVNASLIGLELFPGSTGFLQALLGIREVVAMFRAHRRV